MEFPSSSQSSQNKESLLEKREGTQDDLNFFPLNWFRMLAKETHWSFVYCVVVVNGISQGLGGAVGRVASDYYWKDVQKVQPSVAQVYQGITCLPWIVKPLWGLLTDVLPVGGYRRKPYFIFAGFLGIISMLILWLRKDVTSIIALLLLTLVSTAMAVADVINDACVAQNSITHPSLAADMQTLCGFSSSIGSLIGFSLSGQLIEAIGSKGVLGLLSIPCALIVSVGIILKELHIPNFRYKQTYRKLVEANHTIWATLKCSYVWKSCLYMFVSLALNLDIQEGMFYWYTDSNFGPAFSQGTISFIFSVGSAGSLVGVFLYKSFLQDSPFRGLLFWSQLLSSVSGTLDLILVLRLNLRLRLPDHLFVVIDEGVSQMIARLKWMPLLVLSSRLCPCGVEGTFFALLMSIDHAGMLMSSWLGGLLLNVLKVSRAEFGNLWVAVLIRSVARVLPLALVCLVPKGDHSSANFLAACAAAGDEVVVLPEVRENDDSAIERC